jgi:hypothetical protein
MKINDKVKSHLSLWKDTPGTVSAIIPIWSIEKENCKEGDLVHVIFPETDKHYGYQQSFNSKDLIIVQVQESTQC